MDRELGRLVAIHDVRVVHVVFVVVQAPDGVHALPLAVLDILPADRRDELIVALCVRLMQLGELAPARLEPVLELLIKGLDLPRLNLVNHSPHVFRLVKAAELDERALDLAKWGRDVPFAGGPPAE